MKRCLMYLWLGITFIACQLEKTTDETIERPYSPWVFRSVLDEQARMITLALHDNVWIAYHTETGGLYKAWKGDVNFDGAVYTTAHGPQPMSLGDAWVINKYKSPWRIVNGQGVVQATNFQYKGHTFNKGEATLKYHLTLEDGQIVTIKETPIYASKDNQLAGLKRVFEVEGLPSDYQVQLQTNISSVALESNIITDGELSITNKETIEAKGLTSLDLDGVLTLNSNAPTTLTTYFVKTPLIVNPNAIVAEVEVAEKPLGEQLIDRSDCKTCHNTFVKTIGPSYVDVAKRYENTAANREMLLAKIQNGGAGVWGETAMTAHDDLPKATIQTMVEYIMNLDADEEAVSTEKITTNEALSIISADTSILAEDLVPGCVMQIYQFDKTKNIETLADISFEGTPIYHGIVPNIYADGGDFKSLEDNFGILATGYIWIPKSTNYVFRLRSDDGSRFYLDNQVLIDHDGLHGASPKDGEIALEEGYHPFRLEFFQNKGGRALMLEWNSYDDLAFAPIPPTNFVHHKGEKIAPMAATPPMAITKRIPGDGYALKEVHPSYDLSQARPDDFTPKVGGMDFLSDGRMVISTWDADGGIYIIDGATTGDPTKMRVKKIANGLAEPLGLKVVDDEIYVLQKQELTKLIDIDGDEVIDSYETVCNSWTVSANFHEFTFGLAYKEGYFYGALAIGIMPGGASANPQPKDRGKAVRISKETGEIEFLADGLRTPNGVGLGIDDEVFIADNQGDWLPASKILHVSKNAFFGSRAVNFEGTANTPVKLPVVWLPQDEIGNSPSTPLAIHDGPYKGQMIHGEVTHGGVKRVFVEKVNGAYQGCVFRFIQGLEAGVNRMTWGPDGALYIGGIGSTGNWRQNGKLWYGLQRLKYNQQPTFEMLAVRAYSNGLEIELTEPLEEGLGWEKSDYIVKQWKYVPTANYGGPKINEEDLNVRSATVSNDRKRLFLELDGMKENHVIYLQLPAEWISSTGLELWSTETWYTLNQIPSDKQGIVSSGVPTIIPNTLTQEEKAAGWRLLFDGKTTTGWRNFKKQTIGSSWKVQDGTLMLDAKQRDDGGWQAADGGDIITQEEFGNYELRLEWKISACGNSGIIYNVVESEEYDYVWQTGPEMQILDNACHPDAKIKTHRAGDLYDLIESKYVTVNPAGEWNKVRLIIKDGQLQQWLNGRKVIETTCWNDNWAEMINNSKFSDMPNWGQAKKGHISLQDHGDRVWFRNIKIKTF